MRKVTLRSLSIVGLVIFLPIFIFTVIDPYYAERIGSSFIEWKLESEVNKKIDSISLDKHDSDEGKVAKFLRNNALNKIVDLDGQIDSIKTQLKNDVPSLLASQLAELRNLDCTCRQKWEERLRDGLEFKLSSLEVAKDKLITFAQAKYMEIVENLQLDIRIFSGTNIVVFSFLLLLTFFKPRAEVHLFLPGILLFTSTVICSFFYVLEQNWLFTILYNDYTGFGYVAYLALVFGFLSDIAFNSGRITCEIINFVANAVGSALSVGPC